jgi:hypothetical protein
MCGELDEDAEAGADLFHRFLLAAHDALHHREAHRRPLKPYGDSIPAGELHAYMDGLFADLLHACIADAERTDETNRYRVLSAQAAVFARMAGFLAGHLSPDQDPLHTALDALLDGYAAKDRPAGSHHHHRD